MARPRKDLLTAPVGRTVLELAGPMVIGMAAVILFNVVDTFYVGRLGAQELAAMSFTFPVVFFVMNIAIGMGVGVVSVISRVIGEDDRKRVQRLATDGLILANALVVIASIGGLLTIRPLFTALGASPQMIVLIREYMTPWYIGIGFIVIPMVGNSAIRATGDTKTPSVIMAIAGGVNIILDPLLIFGIGPFPRLELQGAAIATLLSYSITFAAALWILAKREHMIDFSRPKVSEVLASWRVILYVGIPATATNVMLPVANGILTRMVAGFGPTAVAAFGVGTRIEGLSLIGVHALFIAVGALFNPDPEIVETVAHYLWIMPASYGLLGLVQVVSATFNSVNQPMKSALIILLRLFVFGVPLAFVFSRGMGVTGIFVGLACANAVVGVIAYALALRFVHRAEERFARDAIAQPGC
jgi:putative MATE family efflux protein